MAWCARSPSRSPARGYLRHSSTPPEHAVVATVLVYPRDAPQRYLEIRGDVTLVDDPDSQLIHDLVRTFTGAERYTGDEGTDNERVIVRVTPRRVVWRV
ncbi:hypothetical protein GCM10023221_11070 [Luteimicrobium xylanilyticum]|uniref:Pyridoxamine 5'-phosphate oxidase putative domain-containing protein n=1 Tax=Luteimicrobium xylanilyticum TaxID=1133546 RepID=A0A5P9QDF9_9MICO|nr:hypothetical protein [Luteimicrobium xylanilyticum]QFU99417.1 hypothetical protein KDY119_02948 [Luteimicrobium xylanilyticum]